MTIAIAPDTTDLGAELEQQACECIHCPPHREATHCHCDHPAAWAVRIHRLINCDLGHHHVLLCDLCMAVAREWAVAAANVLHGHCPSCLKPIRCAEDLLGPVIAL